MNKSKKILSLFLFIVIVLSVLAVFDITATAEGNAPSGNFITFLSASSFTLNATKRWNGILEYSTDGLSWENYSGGTDLTAAQIGNVGDYYLCLRGTDNTQISATGLTATSPWSINGTAVACSGNIENLLDYTEVVAGTHPEMYNYCFYQMFYNCTALTVAPDLLATDMVNSCYSSMFYGCTSLKAAPALPAITLATECYRTMFSGCTALTEIPALPATNLARSCYYAMFEDCTSLKRAPVLPATSLESYCYYEMFRGCTSLCEPSVLPATTLATSCYHYMFYGCVSLTVAPALPATTLAEYCYYGMFQRCDYLRVAPVISATTLANYSCANMFSNCTSLRVAPALPAINLDTYCYSGMFYGCASLREAPLLPAINLAQACYSSMFMFCSSLRVAPLLPATTMINNCYYRMFMKCTSLTDVPALPATTLATQCYREMFRGCTEIKLYQSADDVVGTPSAWAFPSGIYFGGFSDWSTNMFNETGGSFTEDPQIGTTYYWAAPVSYLNAATEATTVVALHKTVITDIKASTDISDIVTPIAGYTVSVTPSFIGNNVSYNGTGTVINVMSGTEIVDTYTLVVMDDVNGDSFCDALDSMSADLVMYKHAILTGCYLNAADYKNDTQIDMWDFQQLMNYTLSE